MNLLMNKPSNPFLHKTAGSLFSRITDDNGYRKRIIKPNSSITLSKISVGNAQKREKHTLKNANYNTVSRKDKNNISYESNYGIDWGE